MQFRAIGVTAVVCSPRGIAPARCCGAAEDADCEAALAGQGLTYITQTNLVIAAGRTENGDDVDEEEQPLTDEAKAEETEHIAKGTAPSRRIAVRVASAA